MKKIIISVALVVLAVQLFSQAPAGSALSKQDYLNKSKNQKTIGWVMLGGGVVLATAGFIAYGSQFDLSGRGEGYAIAGAAGIGIALGSIPFFISSAKNARKAAEISFRNQQIVMPQQNMWVLKMQPAITLKIAL
jgi:hypothetical protein